MRLKRFRYLLCFPFFTLFFGSTLSFEAAAAPSPEVKRQSDVTLVPADALTTECQKDVKDGKFKVRDSFVSIGSPVVTLAFTVTIESAVDWPGCRTLHGKTIGNILNRGPPSVSAA